MSSARSFDDYYNETILPVCKNILQPLDCEMVVSMVYVFLSPSVPPVVEVSSTEGNYHPSAFRRVKNPCRVKF